MKREEPGLSRLWIALYRLLILIALALSAAIVGVSVYAVYWRPAAAVPATRPPDADYPARQERYFTGIGRLRAASADPVPATIIVSVAFPYDSTDVAFFEELASRVQDFRDLAKDLFSSYTVEKLQTLGENAVKEELLRRWNNLLRLGKIRVLYFNDYLIVQ